MRIKIYTFENKEIIFENVKNNILIKSKDNSLTIKQDHIPLTIGFVKLNLFFETENNKKQFFKLTNGILCVSIDSIDVKNDMTFFCNNFKQLTNIDD
uniref:ATP synthase CF1 epsilon subunit n=1 Tax=Nitzschia sp. (in: diatoms) TaxID=1884248 RepID=A0A5J6DUN8_9STRA|nr:hypothetical protein [Nitzschia sp. (in: diatoms)]